VRTRCALHGGDHCTALLVTAARSPAAGAHSRPCKGDGTQAGGQWTLPQHGHRRPEQVRAPGARRICACRCRRSARPPHLAPSHDGRPPDLSIFVTLCARCRLTKTFSTLSFITVGDKYGAKEKGSSRFLGKQFQTVGTKAGRTANTYFTSMCPRPAAMPVAATRCNASPLTSAALRAALHAEEFRVLHGSYADTQPQRYNQTQPRDKRKKGFLSGDARKRDMAMNTTMGVIMGETFHKVCVAC